MKDNTNELQRFLAVATPEEWKWWIEDRMINQPAIFGTSNCLFCRVYIFCHECMKKPPCNYQKNNSDILMAGLDRLERAGMFTEEADSAY